MWYDYYTTYWPSFWIPGVLAVLEGQVGLEGPQLGQNKREELYKAWCLSQGVPAGPQRGAHSPFHAEGYPPYSWKWGTLTQKEIKLILIGLGGELRFFIITPMKPCPRLFRTVRKSHWWLFVKASLSRTFWYLHLKLPWLLQFTQETEHVTPK